MGAFGTITAFSANQALSTYTTVPLPLWGSVLTPLLSFFRGTSDCRENALFELNTDWSGQTIGSEWKMEDAGFAMLSSVVFGLWRCFKLVEGPSCAISIIHFHLVFG